MTIDIGQKISRFNNATDRQAVVDLWANAFGYETAHNDPSLAIDATALESSQFTVTGGSALSTNDVQSISLLPGAYLAVVPALGSGAAIQFAVTSEGLFEFDSTLNSFVSGGARAGQSPSCTATAI